MPYDRERRAKQLMQMIRAEYNALVDVDGSSLEHAVTMNKILALKAELESIQQEYSKLPREHSEKFVSYYEDGLVDCLLVQMRCPVQKLDTITIKEQGQKWRYPATWLEGLKTVLFPKRQLEGKIEQNEVGFESRCNVYKIWAIYYNITVKPDDDPTIPVCHRIIHLPIEEFCFQFAPETAIDIAIEEANLSIKAEWRETLLWESQIAYYPKTWWEQLKDRFLPRALKKKFPVVYNKYYSLPKLEFVALSHSETPMRLTVKAKNYMNKILFPEYNPKIAIFSEGGRLII